VKKDGLIRVKITVFDSEDQVVFTWFDSFGVLWSHSEAQSLRSKFYEFHHGAVFRSCSS
jgi:hypothetical protein